MPTSMQVFEVHWILQNPNALHIKIIFSVECAVRTNETEMHRRKNDFECGKNDSEHLLETDAAARKNEEKK